MDDQIRWAVEQTKQYASRILERNQSRIAADANRRAEERTNQEMPLGRAGATGPGNQVQQAEDKPVSLSDAIDYATNLRRL